MHSTKHDLDPNKTCKICMKQEGNVLQEPAAAMHLKFPMKGLYNVWVKSVFTKSMIPKFGIMWSFS